MNNEKTKKVIYNLIQRYVPVSLTISINGSKVNEPQVVPLSFIHGYVDIIK